MNRLPAALHRASVGLVAAVLLVVGGAAIVWGAGRGPAARWVERLDARSAVDLVESHWWAWILVAAVLVPLVWGAALFSTAARPVAVGSVELPGSDRAGELIVAPQAIADAVQERLAANSRFRSVKVRAINDRARRLVRIEVVAPPQQSYEELIASIGEAVVDINAAFEASDVQVQALIHLERRSGATVR